MTIDIKTLVKLSEPTPGLAALIPEDPVTPAPLSVDTEWKQALRDARAGKRDEAPAPVAVKEDPLGAKLDRLSLASQPKY